MFFLTKIFQMLFASAHPSTPFFRSKLMWTKRLIDWGLTHIYFGFFIFHIWLCYGKPIISSSVGNMELHKLMILKILWCPIFTPLIIPLVGAKIACVTFLSQVCLVLPQIAGEKWDIFKKDFLTKKPLTTKCSLKSTWNSSK